MSAPPAIVYRRAWLGDALPPRRAAALGRVELAVVHHTGLAADARAIHHLHQQEQGWDDIGYNLLVDAHGRVFEGRAGGLERPVVGAHTLGWSARSTGIAVLGDHSREPLAPAGLDALLAVLRWKLGLHGLEVSARTVRMHCDLAATACPGRALVQQLAALLHSDPSPQRSR